MLVRYIVLISGKVHKGGFRSFVKKNALMLGITGYAENLSTGEVLLVLEGNEDSILKLLEKVEKEAPSFIKIENIYKRREEYKGSFSDFERKGVDVMEDLNSTSTKELLMKIVHFSKSTDEKLERGIEILGTMKNQLDIVIEKQDKMLNKQDEMLRKQDEMLKKQDEMINKQDEMLNKQDEMLRKQDEMVKKQEETVEEIKKTRNELKEEISKTGISLQERFKRIEEEIEKIKKALSKAGIEI